ncbi:MAG: hypothetical protein AAF726_14510 [Planctomycetota bacterium]
MATADERLPLERERAVSARSVAFVLAIAAALVLVVNAAAIRRSPAATRSFDGRTVAVKWDLASKGLASDGIVVIGDSSGNFAVSTDVLEAELGRPALNLCTYGRFEVLGAGWFLDRALETSEAPPSLVVVVLGSRTYALVADGFTLAQIPAPIGSWSDRVPGVGLGPLDAFQLVCARLFPLYAQHKGFELGLRKRRWTIDPSRLPILERGTSKLPFAYPDGVAPFAEKTVKELVSLEGPVPSVRDRRSLAGLVRDADARGYDVVFADGPVWSGLAARPEHAEFLARVHAYLDEICAGSERAHRLTGGLQTFEPDVMENPFHLTAPAAVRFSTELAQRLQAIGVPR